MFFHNVMEEIMYKEVNRLYDEAKKNGEEWLVCDCIQCRVDAMCYALNRVKPRYIKSGKGLAYFFQVDFKMGSQFFVDISSVALEAMKVVQANRGPHTEEETEEDISSYKACFNFPTIKCKINDGNNLRPMNEVTVKLLLNDVLVEQMDVLWDNPYTIHSNMGGVCTFWPKPQKADEEGIAKNFNFMLVVEKENYESVKQAFSLNIVSTKNAKENFDVTSCHEIKDIYMFEKTPDAMQINPSLS
ncbi:MAG: late competence development ComFB family protein [Treponema sp.]